MDLIEQQTDANLAIINWLEFVI